MERHTLAYLILAVIVVAIGGWAAFRWYHARERTYHRRQTRERRAYQELMGEKAADENS